MKKFALFLGVLIAFAFGVWYFLLGARPLSEIFPDSTKNEEIIPNLIKVLSPKFAEGAFIPIEYTCDDENINPPLVISGVPKEAKSLALIVEDPDAPLGTFGHWVLWNISPETVEIKERETPEGAVLGKNDFNSEKYRGPCPPNSTHRYYFKIYALDRLIDLPAGSYREDLIKSMKGHVIAQGQLMAKYSRYQKE